MSVVSNFKNIFRPSEAKRPSKFEIRELPKGKITISVDNYVSAADSASSSIIQNRVTLYNHYDQTMMFDYYFKSLLTKRLTNIERKRLVLLDNDKEYEDINYFLEAPKFRQFLQDIILTKFYGMSLFEFQVTKDKHGKDWFDYYKIPIKHINPFRREVVAMETQESGESFDKPDCLFLGDKDDLGLMLQCTLLSLYRRLGLFDYGKYVDLASENFTQLITREYGDNEGANNLLKNLSERGGGGVFNAPPGVEISSENQSSSQQNQLFDNYLKMLKEEMAIFVLGQTMTTEDGSSRSQAEVHQAEQGHIFQGDDKYVIDTLNYDVYDYMHMWGFEMKPSMRFAFVPFEDDNVDEVTEAESRKEQAKLRSSGEGAKTIIELQRAVSENIMNPEQAVKILIYQFGFSEEVSKEIIYAV